MGWFWKKTPVPDLPDPDKAAIELLVRECAPRAKVVWDGSDLRIEGLERAHFDEVGQRLWNYRNGLLHQGGKPHAPLFLRSTLLDPEEVETEQQARALNHAVGRVSKAFEFIDLLLPKRLADEEIGDALELMNRLVQEGRPRWQIYVKGASAVFFVLLNWLREVTSSLLGKKNKA